MSVLRSLLAVGDVTNFGENATEHLLLISDVAEKVELEPKTIRFYEKAGLLKPRRLGQLRVFTNSDIEVLLLVKKLRQYGMPIALVREALDLHQQREHQGDSRLKKMLSAQLERLTNKHRELAEQIAVLDHTLSAQPGTRAA
jgi:DNA-binding transcriptional MerR regulator